MKRKRRKLTMPRWIRSWRMRARKWHPGQPHHEVVCSYDEWLAVQPRRERKKLRDSNA
jgi:hypothetical protein